ncbi:MAG: iron-sulfur cluster assembly accessory protein [Candidatus Yanofskybacteria bacterium]|nr:iron-sulfur cluster assembly accessory protein [Candidatus Yanofskybacteria bacterium]
MITLTPKAVAKFKEIISKQEKPEEIKGLRVAVQGGGCSGFQYSLAFEKEPKPDDKVFEFDGLKVFVDQKSLLYLMGTQIDYVDDLCCPGFKFTNPNAQGTCGCGESFHT